MLTIGLLSGTSIDGVDATLIDCSTPQPSLLASLSYDIPEATRQRINGVATNPATPLADAIALHGELGELFADAALALMSDQGLTAADVTAIGSHGQTVFHQPLANPPATLQLGNAAIIAARTGVQVVADFRVNDMAHGGQGAPLAPLLHQQLFGHQNKAVLNLGGIANLTLLSPDQATLGYDTGPANTFMDSWTQQHQNKPFDKNGAWAKSGVVNTELLVELLNDSYFHEPAPKSTGTDYFSRDWLDNKLKSFTKLNAADVQATLAELTVITVANALKAAMPKCSELLVCGGGALNGHLLERLHAVTGIQTTSTASQGYDPQWVEGILFGWLAYRRISGLPGNLPSVTGASKACLLGAIYPA